MYEAEKHRYIDDHCEADRIWKSVESVNRWLSDWGWVDWPQTYPHSWLREEGSRSWSDLTSAEPPESNKIPDIKFEVRVKDLDGRVRTELREGTLIDSWVEEVDASQDGQMVIHAFDGPSLTDTLMRSGRPRQGERPVKKGEGPAPSVREQGTAVHGSGLTIRHTEDGEVAFAIHGDEGNMYVWQFPPQAARVIAQELLREAESAERLLSNVRQDKKE